MRHGFLLWCCHSVISAAIGMTTISADAITEDLTTDLSRLPGAFVIARHSAATYKGKPIDVRRVGEELGVRYAVEGSVRNLGGLLRVNVQLISTETNTHLWAGRFDQNVAGPRNRPGGNCQPIAGSTGHSGAQR